MTDFIPRPDLRAATEAAIRLWKTYHPQRRVPDDHDHELELRELARSMAALPLDAIPFVAEQALDLSHGRFPNPLEVRKAASAFLKRQDDRAAGWGEIAHPLDDTTAVDAQCDAILRGLKLDDPAVAWPAKARGITAVMESVTHGIQRAIAAGTMPQSRMAELRAGTYPTPKQLERDAQRLHDAAATLTRRAIREATP